MADTEKKSGFSLGLGKMVQGLSEMAQSAVNTAQEVGPSIVDNLHGAIPNAVVKNVKKVKSAVTKQVQALTGDRENLPPRLRRSKSVDEQSGLFAMVDRDDMQEDIKVDYKDDTFTERSKKPYTTFALTPEEYARLYSEHHPWAVLDPARQLPEVKRVPQKNWTKEECKKVFNAAKHGRLDELKGYINSGAPVDCKPYGSQTPLYIASFYGRVECIHFLAEMGADLMCVDKDDFTPAHAAASQGHMEALTALKAHGADLLWKNKNNQDCLGLSEKNNPEIHNWLIETYDITIEKWGPSNQKKIFNAAKHGRLEELKGYIEDGGPIHCTPYGSQTPLYISAFYGRAECVKFLAESGADLNATEKDNFTAAHAAASQGQLDALKALHEAGADIMSETPAGQNCKSLASKHDDVLAWLRKTFPTDKWDKAAQKKIFNAAKYGRLEELKGYIEDGGPIDCTPFGSQSPLYIAAFYGKADCVKFLAENGAELNKTEKDGYTAAHAAASQGQLEALKELFNAGADMKFSTDGGQDCLVLAKNAKKTDVIDWLKNAALRDPPDWTNTEDQKLIFNAAKQGDLDLLKRFIEVENGPPMCTPFGSQTPLYIAAFYNRAGCVKFLAGVDGVDLNVTEKDGMTAAHGASSRGSLDSLKALYEAGADLSIEAPGGKTCLTLAIEQGRENVTNWLLDMQEEIENKQTAGGPDQKEEDLEVKEVEEQDDSNQMDLGDAAKNIGAVAVE